MLLLFLEESLDLRLRVNDLLLWLLVDRLALLLNLKLRGVRLLGSLLSFVFLVYRRCLSRARFHLLGDSSAAGDELVLRLQESNLIPQLLNLHLVLVVSLVDIARQLLSHFCLVLGRALLHPLEHHFNCIILVALFLSLLPHLLRDECCMFCSIIRTVVPGVFSRSGFWLDLVGVGPLSGVDALRLVAPVLLVGSEVQLFLLGVNLVAVNYCLDHPPHIIFVRHPLQQRAQTRQLLVAWVVVPTDCRHCILWLEQVSDWRVVDNDHVLHRAAQSSQVFDKGIVEEGAVLPEQFVAAVLVRVQLRHQRLRVL